MNTGQVYILLSTVFLFLGVIVIHWIHSQYRIGINIPTEIQPICQNLPLISIIIPARNEARNIQRCINALQSQTYSNLEIIIVNDRSTDATAHILAEILASTQVQDASGYSHLIKVIQGTDLPAGWVGKPHALHQGYQLAQGEWLCFIDADTFASPGLIASTHKAANLLNADLLTIVTNQELRSFWEKVILPLVFTALTVGFPPKRVNDSKKPDAIANGQFILIRRSVYEAVGGHQAVRLAIAEDKALAELVKGKGFHLVLADGSQLASTRMYTSLSEIWEGWTKNMYLGLQDRVWLLLVGALVGLIGALGLPLWLIMNLAWVWAGGGWMAALAALQALGLLGYLLYMRMKMSQSMGISYWYAITFPLGALFFTAMLITSGFNVLTGRGVIWKGRSYS